MTSRRVSFCQNRTCSFAFAFVAFVAFITPLAHADPLGAPKPEIGFVPVPTTYLEFIELTEHDFDSLMARFPIFRETELRMAVQDLVEKGKARVVDTVLAQARAGSTTGVDSVLQIMNPDQPGPPQGLGKPYRVWPKEVGTVARIQSTMKGMNVELSYLAALGTTPRRYGSFRYYPPLVCSPGTMRAGSKAILKPGEFRYLSVFRQPAEDGKPGHGRRTMLFARVLLHQYAYEIEKPDKPDFPTDPFAAAATSTHGIDPFSPTGAPLSPTPPTPPTDPGGFTLQVEAIRVPHSELTAMLIGYAPAVNEDGGRLRDRVQSLIDSGAAELVEFSLMRGNGEKLSSTVGVLRPLNIVRPTADELARRSAREGVDPSGSGTALVVEYKMPLSEKVGLEVWWKYPFVREQRPWIETELGINLIRPVRGREAGRGANPDGEGLPVDLSRFYAEKLWTRLVLPFGGYVLAGVTTPADESGKPDPEFRTMFFVRGTYQDGK